MAGTGKKLAGVPLRFDRREWEEEVDRLDRNAMSRIQAERARKEMDRGGSEPALRRCESDGADGTRLVGCAKLYVPLGKEGASEAPYGFVFQLAQDPDGSLLWNFLAFGQRHPTNPATRSVYERAHKRLHGRYPEVHRPAGGAE